MKSNASSIDDAVGIFGRIRLAGEGDLCPSESVRIYKNIVEPRNNRHTEKIAEPLAVGGKGWPLANPAEAPDTKVWVKRETSATSRSPTWIIYMIRVELRAFEWGLTMCMAHIVTILKRTVWPIRLDVYVLWNPRSQAPNSSLTRSVMMPMIPRMTAVIFIPNQKVISPSYNECYSLKISTLR